MALQHRELLIVEDNSSLQQMLIWEFEDLGYSVTTAGNCADALAAIREHVFDLALLDCNLPDGLGPDLMEELHRHLPTLPVILCSGQVSSCKPDSGAFRFVPKPISAQAIHTLFQQALSEHNRS